MGLQFVKQLLGDESGVVILSTSTNLDFYIRKQLKEKLNTTTQYIYNINTDKELNDVIENGLVAPLEGDKWLFHINIDLISSRVMEKALKKHLPYAYLAMWSSDFRTFNNFLKSTHFKKVEDFFPVEKFNFLTLEDTRYYINDTIPEQIKELEPQLVDFIVGNYRYDVKGLFDFVQLVQMGEKFTDKQSVIDAIGVGSISTDTLLMKLLTADTYTDKKEMNRFKDILNYYSYLKNKYEPRVIINYLEIGCNNIMLLKQMYIMGYLKNHNAQVPSYVDMDKLKRYNRYIKVVKEEISMIDILNLKIAISKHKSNFKTDFSDSELAFMRIISQYLNSKPHESLEESIKREMTKEKRAKERKIKREKEKEEKERKALAKEIYDASQEEDYFV